MTLTVAVLVSEGRHPVSGRVRRADCDARALELALCLPYTELLVIHAGAERSPALPSYLGMGPGEATVIPLKEGADPTAPLTELLTARRPDLILTGVRAESGEGAGFLPYSIAHALDRPILTDACEVEIKDGRIDVLQALPKGRRRRLRARLPALVTVGPAAPAPRQSAFAKARRGRIVPHAVSHAVPASDLAAPPWTAAPAKPRPKRLKAVDPNASAEERLKAITEMSGGQGEVLVGLSPDAAAGRLLDYLVEAGAVPHTQTALDLEKPAT